MGERVEVLDHGYVELVEAWGSDERIVEAARQSTQKGFLGWGPVCPGCGDSERGYDLDGKSCVRCGSTEARKPGDEKLLRYMWEHEHSTPFEFAGAVFEVQAPIFVFREWHRHRTQSYSEASARYAPLLDLNYVPTVSRMLVSGGGNKQAGTVANAGVLDEHGAATWSARVEESYAFAQQVYEEGLVLGVPKELARVVLPVGRFSRMRASANLRNWLGFLRLREAPNAQYEIRQYAGALHQMLAGIFPRTVALYESGRK